MRLVTMALALGLTLLFTVPTSWATPTSLGLLNVEIIVAGGAPCALKAKLPLFAGGWRDIDLPTESDDGADARHLGTCKFDEMSFTFYGEKLLGADGSVHYAFAVRTRTPDDDSYASLMAPNEMDRERVVFILSSNKKKGDSSSPDFMAHFKVSPSTVLKLRRAEPARAR